MTDDPFTAPSDDGPTIVRANGSGELLAVVPYLLGFHPTNSLVVLGLLPSGGTRLHTGPAARVDLPQPGWERAAVRAVLPRVAAVPEVAAVAVVVYREAGPEGREAPETAIVDEVRSLLASSPGVTLLDALRVDAGRWTSLLCRDAACCPPDGTPLRGPADPGGPSRLGAVAALAGIAPLRDRAALVERVAAVDDLPARLVAAGVDDQCVVVARLRAAGGAGAVTRRAEAVVAVALATPAHEAAAPPAHDVTVQLLALLDDLDGRDAALAAMLSGHREHEARARELVCHLLRRAPAGLAAAPAAVLAALALVVGDGALCRVALDRAFDEEAAYPLAVLLEHVADIGPRPDEARTLLRREPSVLPGGDTVLPAGAAVPAGARPRTGTRRRPGRGRAGGARRPAVSP